MTVTSKSAPSASDLTTVVILAGGQGTRIAGLTHGAPKCLLRMGDDSLLGCLLRSFVEGGFRRIVLLSGSTKNARILRSWTASRSTQAASIVVAPNAVPSDGPAAGLCSLRRQIETPYTLLALGDVVFQTPPLAGLLSNPDLYDGGLLGCSSNLQMVTVGAALPSEGTVRLIERPSSPIWALKWSGLAHFPTTWLEMDLPALRLLPVGAILDQRQPLRAFDVPEFVNVNTPDDYVRALTLYGR